MINGNVKHHKVPLYWQSKNHHEHDFQYERMNPCLNHFYTQSNKQQQKNYKITSLYFFVQVYPLHKLLKIMQFSSSSLLNNKLMNSI